VLATLTAAPAAATTGPSSSQSPYLVGVAPGVGFESIITAGDTVGGFTFGGIPDGLGAFDNGNGTYTLIVAHELNSSEGVAHAHNAATGNGKGAYLDKLIVDKATNRVLVGGDLVQQVVLTSGGSLNFNRFCSGDLPAVSALYNAATGKGTKERFFLNGEEAAGGRAFAHQITGLNAGTSYELGAVGQGSFETQVPNPGSGDKTILVGPSDGGNNNVYVYVGDKRATGATEIDKAGLTGGTSSVIAVPGLATEDRANGLSTTTPTFSGSFTLAAPGSGTSWLKPEDATWDAVDPTILYFHSSDRYSQTKDSPPSGAQDGRTRLWRLKFSSLANPAAGGTITSVLPETSPVQILDNITDDGTRLILLEDAGDNAHNSKIWSYEKANGRLTLQAKHDPARFGDYDTHTSPTPPFTQDEESSGVIPATDILGPGWFFIADQAHYPSGNPATVQGGQLLAMFLPPAATRGYWLVGADGGVFSFGASFYGSTGNIALNRPIVAMASTPRADGYWFTASDGGVFAYGAAGFFGSTGNIALNRPVVGMAATPSGRGYWLVASDGGIFAYGDARFFGSTGGTALRRPIVGMAATPSGKGYWLVASDGGIFSYGDAAFYGSAGGVQLNQPVVGMAATKAGSGYYLVASDGGVFAYGAAPMLGSAGGSLLNRPVVAIAADPDGRGYWLVASDGGIFSYSAPFAGSTGGSRLNRPIVGMAPT
jgi:hypothetical protein